jgi:hypothetical protein
MSQVMLLIWACLAALQALFLTLVWGVGIGRFFNRRGADESRSAATPSAAFQASLIIPLTGRSPSMEAALASFLNQDYPRLETLLVTSGESDPAHDLARQLAERHRGLRHVTAGAAVHCAQKNHNLLAGIAAASRQARLYVFCDANHIGRTDLIRRLAAPILRGEAEFTTGYREAALEAHAPGSVSLRLILWSMGQFQAMPLFTQPWGGAMAMSVSAYQRLEVEALWSRTVVDDCSLAGLLAKSGVRVKYCPEAMLRTPVRAMDFQALLDWFTRQLLYPKFYTRTAWRLLGLGLASSGILFAASLALLLAEGLGAFTAPGAVAAAGGHLGLPLALGVLLRRRLVPRCPWKTWWAGFGVTLAVLFRAYFRTLGAKRVVWRGIGYEVDEHGEVARIEHAVSRPSVSSWRKKNADGAFPGGRSDGG